MTWMFHWLSYSNLRLTSLSLLVLSSLLVLAGLFALKSSVPLAVSLVSKLRQEHMRNFGSGSWSSLPLLDSYPDRLRLVSSYRINVIAGLILVLALGSIWADIVEHPIGNYWDVRFIEPTPDSNGYSWKVEDADGTRRIDFCNDYNVPALNIQPGEVARRIRFRYMGACDSIKEDGLRIWFYRDKADWTVETNLSRQFNQVIKEIKDAERTR